MKPPPGNPGRFSLPNLGTYEAVIPAFASKVRKWLEGSSLTFVRLAFAPQLFMPVAGRQEGYDQIMVLVPSLKLESNAEVSELSSLNGRHGDAAAVSFPRPTIPDAARWIFSIAMLLGRLELLAVLVMLRPDFWR
jgi:hypothetical protein